MGRPVSFVLRISSFDQKRLQGQIEHVPSGTTSYFADLDQAAAFIRRHLAEGALETVAPAPRGGAVVDSIFPFLRRRAAAATTPPEDAAPATPPEAASAQPAVPAVAAEPAPAASPPLGGEPASLTPPISLQPYAEALLALLRPFLPAGPDPSRPASLSFIALAQRSLGLGGCRGLLRSGGLDVAELRGGWLEARVRCELWAASLDALNARVAELQSALLVAAPELRASGLLQLQLANSSAAETIDGVWRRALDYHVLYEYRYQDTDGAVGLIARIPIHAQHDLGGLDLTTVSDHLVRWDNQAAPALLIQPGPRASLQVLGLQLASFVPGGAPIGTITQTIVQGGETLSTSFSSLAAFQALFTPIADTLDLLTIPPPLMPGEVQATRAFQVSHLRF
ncbi:MAG: hypothetical protein SNJ69_04135, partial [Chloroflexaceae bacterium]